MEKIEIIPYQPQEYSDRYNTDSETVDPQTEVRIFTTAGIRRLLVALEPYLDGTLGDVSPRHAALYLAGMKELNDLWNARYHRGGVGSLENAGPDRVEARREQVLGMLDNLRQRGYTP